MNTLAYIFYLLITYIITVHVGLRFYRNGEVYILRLLKEDLKLTRFINKMLLVGYYLLNLGYAAMMLSTWKTLHSWTDVVLSVFTMTGRIMLTLAVIHFMNMAAIYIFSRKHDINILHHKN